MHPLVRRCAVALALATPGLAVGACAAPPKASLAAAPMAAGSASLALQAQVRPTAGQRRLLANNPGGSNWQAKDVDQIEVSLREWNGSGWDLRARTVRLGPDAALPMIFHGLHAGQLYRAEAKAYRAGGIHQQNQISDDAASMLEIQMEDDDAVVKGVLPVQLADKIYDGKATAAAGIGFAAGDILNGLSGVVATMAGNAAPGGVNGGGESAGFNGPSGVALGSGGYWVVERGGHRVRYVSLTNYMVSTVAGSGSPGFTDQGAPGGAAGVVFNAPEGIHSLGSQYNAIVADTGNHRIREINFNAGQVSSQTLAGGAGPADYVDDPNGANARFSSPAAVWRAGSWIYVADRGNNRIRRVDMGGQHTVDTIAGGGPSYVTSAPFGTSAQLDSPTALAMDGNDMLYVACREGRQIWRIDTTNQTFPIELIAGTGSSGDADGDGLDATFMTPTGLAYDTERDRLYVADAGSHRIRMIDCSDTDFPVTTLAGDSQAYADGVGTAARFNQPCGLAFDGGTRNSLLVADRGNHRLRVVR